MLYNDIEFFIKAAVRMANQFHLVRPVKIYILSVPTFFFRLLKKKVRLIEYINLTITVGGLIGILTTAFDKEFYNHYTTVFWLTIIFFTIQTTTSFYYDKFKRIGIVL